MRRVRIIGGGRAGTSLAIALQRRDWKVLPLLGREDDLSTAAKGVDLVVIATPDTVISEVAGSIAPRSDVVVAHMSGALDLQTLLPHKRRASFHPLASLPSAERGAERLLEGAWFAIEGDPIAKEVVDVLGGKSLRVHAKDRAVYHATAVMASNHIVALLGQVERMSNSLGIPFEAFLNLAEKSLDNVRLVGPALALTGPSARGDQVTVEKHLSGLPPEERPGYEVMADLAWRLAQESRR